MTDPATGVSTRYAVAGDRPPLWAAVVVFVIVALALVGSAWVVVGLFEVVT